MDKEIIKEYKECFQNIIVNKQKVTEDGVYKTWEHIKESISETATKVPGKEN